MVWVKQKFSQVKQVNFDFLDISPVFDPSNSPNHLAPAFVLPCSRGASRHNARGVPAASELKLWATDQAVVFNGLGVGMVC